MRVYIFGSSPVYGHFLIPTPMHVTKKTSSSYVVMDDGQRRKRKLEDEEESEEEKMEKFFALVRSTGEVRERMTSALLRAKAEGEKKPIEKNQSGWNPTFQPEDFMVDAQLKIIDHGRLVAAGSSKKEEEKGKEKEGDGLNLNLSL